LDTGANHHLCKETPNNLKPETGNVTVASSERVLFWNWHLSGWTYVSRFDKIFISVTQLAKEYTINGELICTIW
jgi:hypothetical protein